MKSIHVLFVCSGNTCRSPFAEAALIHFLKESPSEKAKYVSVSSAGLHAQDGQTASLLAAQVAEHYHLNLAQHHSTLLTEALVKKSNLILVMTYSHLHAIAKCFPSGVDKTFLMTHWYDNSEIVDPFAGSTDTYIKVFEHMMLSIPSIAQQTLNLVSQIEIL